jgi:hypothetical protein
MKKSRNTGMMEYWNNGMNTERKNIDKGLI